MLGVNLASSKLAHSGGLFYIRQLAVFLGLALLIVELNFLSLI